MVAVDQEEAQGKDPARDPVRVKAKVLEKARVKEPDKAPDEDKDEAPVESQLVFVHPVVKRPLIREGLPAPK